MGNLGKYISSTRYHQCTISKINSRIKSLLLVVMLIMLGGGGTQLSSNDNKNIISKKEKTILVIGDSISQGYKLTKSRLYPKKDLTKKNEYGQISFAIEQGTKAKVLNNGIPDKTTFYIKENWDINVATENPDIVYIHVGVNDFRKGYKFEDVKPNFLWIIQKCKADNIKLIMANIGGYKNIPQKIEKEIIKTNNWLKTQDVELIDYVKWSTNGTEKLGYLKPNMFADSIHPTKEGYMEYGQYILDNSTINQ